MNKRFLLILGIILSLTEVQSQNLELGFGFGSGLAYIVENSDNNIDINYSSPFSSFIDLKYSESEKYFGAKLRFQYLNVGIEGSNWKTNNSEIDGEVASLTTMVLLEHLKTDKSWNLGYNLGLGYTNQSFRPDLLNSSAQLTNNYMSVNLGGIISKKLSENFHIRIEPSALWTDPVNSLRNSDKWQIAGEDLSFLMQFGLVYKVN